MIAGRIAASTTVAAAAAAALVLGVTWASETPTPWLERSTSSVLFDDVQLTPGVPIVRCTGVVPREGGLDAISYHGEAVGSLGPAVTIRVERGIGTPRHPSDCSGFVPVAAVHHGALHAMPHRSAPATEPAALSADHPLAYRVTLTLAAPVTGSTRFSLGVTGRFAELPPPPEPCRQWQSRGPVERRARTRGVRLTVRTPRSLPIHAARTLPVYVTTSDRRRPVVRAGGRSFALGRTPGGRWVVHVPIHALRASRLVEVRSGAAVVTVPVVQRPCAVRFRPFLRRGRILDLRIDAQQPIAGARIALPRVARDASGGTVSVRAIGADGRARTARGRLATDGRTSTGRLPTVALRGDAVELLDVPDRVHAISLRLRIPAAERAWRTVCRTAHRARGAVATTHEGTVESHPIRAAIRPIGERCREPIRPR